MQQLDHMLRDAGYIPRRRELLALAGALAARGRNGGAACLLLEGPSGCGKSALARAAATATGATLVMYQCHAWTDADELFVGVDVAAAVAGDSEAVRQDGALLRVAREAEQGEVVFLLDELDKTSERAEALLLDWLQSGRVPVRPGVQVETRLDRVLVVITSNGQRSLSDPLLRRCRRVAMEPLPVGVQEELIARATGAPTGLVRVAWKAARQVAAAEGNQALSPQEGAGLVAELRLAESAGDVRESLAGWAARADRGRAAAARSTLVSAVWAEVLRWDGR